MILAGYSFAWYCVGSKFESRLCNEQLRRFFFVFSMLSPSKYRENNLTIVHDRFLMHSSTVLVDAVHLHCRKHMVKQLGECSQ